MQGEANRSQRFSIFEALGSTNESILAAGENHEPEGTTHIARRQTHGRGRGDHSWWSPSESGLWMSTLLRPRIDPRRWGGISLVAGAAAHDVLRSAGVHGLRLFWPNDLQVGARKLGGVLGEIRGGEDKAWVALGIGINIDLRSETADSRVPPDLRDRITSMVEEGAPDTTNPVELAAAILARFWVLYDEFQAGRTVAGVVGDRLAHHGGRVTVRVGEHGPFSGTLHGLGSLGELLVKVSTADRKKGSSLPPGMTFSEEGVVAVISGDVVYEDDNIGDIPGPGRQT